MRKNMNIVFIDILPITEKKRIEIWVIKRIILELKAHRTTQLKCEQHILI